MKILQFLTLFLLMLITGTFWGTWFTLTRSLDSFSAPEFAHIGQVIIANVAIPMRFIMPAGILIMLAALLFYPYKRSAVFYFGTFSFILLMLVLLVTLIVLVPIDNHIKFWTLSTIPDNWEDIRSIWKFFHEIRTLLSLGSFAFFTVFILMARPRRVSVIASPHT